MIWERLVRPVLFRRDAEEAHDLALGRLSRWRLGGDLAEALVAVEDDALTVRLGPLTFRNPIGLAAGLDKHGTASFAWPWLGFGAYEVGTVTARPQAGNPRPRLFRLPAAEAIINRYGFNSPGAEAVARALARDEGARRPDVPRGVNVGKNRDTPPERAAADHRACIERLRPFADYFVVNLSSPNTPDLRTLQQPRFMEALVADAVDAARGVPVFAKLAPDWSDGDDELCGAADAALRGGAAGLVATNTTVARDALAIPGVTAAEAGERGGLSGRPLRRRALGVLHSLRRHLGPAVPIVGVGGISTAADAFERLMAGADVLQIYTAFVYRGPLLPGKLLRGLRRLLAEAGLESVEDLRARRGSAALPPGTAAA